VDDAETRGDGRWVGRAAVDEEGGAVGQRDVGLSALRDTVRAEAAGSLAPVPPDGLATARVVVVGPDEELQALAGELERRLDLVDGLLAALGLPQRPGIGRELHHHAPAGQPRPVEGLDHGRRLLELGWPEEHLWDRRPGGRRLLAGEYDDAAAELLWSR
jgi:hypothetical protein